MGAGSGSGLALLKRLDAFPKQVRWADSSTTWVHSPLQGLNGHLHVGYPLVCLNRAPAPVQREEAAEFFNRTSAGGAITIVSALFMALLFFSELRECPARRSVQISCQGCLLALGAGCPPLARLCWPPPPPAASGAPPAPLSLNPGGAIAASARRAVYEGDHGQRAERGHQ
jgi:hypothetical protein